MTALLPVLARLRVPLGFVAAAVTLAVARPTPTSLVVGGVLALCGEAVRIWAAGHLEKSREVTRSGPYRLMRHPLYVGSSVMAAGIVVAANSVVAGVVAAAYMVSTITAAIRTEEAFLRKAFGDTYDAYARSAATPMARRFSAARVVRNREYRAVVGLLVGFALLALRAQVFL
jgi:protein-S-isoprenylcysteine O-methyltransferase Ste14